MTSATTTEIPGYVAGTWDADPAHSEVSFQAKHLGLTKVRGRFASFTAAVVTAENILDSSVTAEIDLSSLDTGVGPRDEHVRSAEFLDVATYPTMTFRSTGIRRGDEDYLIDGELTLHGVTRPVTLTAELNGIGPNVLNNDVPTLGVSASTSISRRDFGVGPDATAVVGDKIGITLEIEAALRS